jgi:hypothetical protein
MAGVSGKKGRKKKTTNRTLPILAACAIVAVVLGSVALLLYHPASHTASLTARSTNSSTSSLPKYDILYINQGNGVVNESNFGSMLSFASSHGFNSIFFQVYREGTLLFDTGQLSIFVSQAHEQNIKIFFSLYITNNTQATPTSIYPLGEDGISLDMSALAVSDQSSYLASLKQGYSGGLTAVTTTDLTLPLSPDLLVVETYGPQIQQFSQYIHPGVIAGVGVFDTTSQSDYQQEVQYALANSDGVMVFDYAGLMKSGY